MGAQAHEAYPADPEAWALAGRVEKDNWISCWRRAGAGPGESREPAAYEGTALVEAIEPYHKGLGRAGHHYSGINALTLQLLRRHLGGDTDDAGTGKAAWGVRWACATALSSVTERITGRAPVTGDRTCW